MNVPQAVDFPDFFAALWGYPPFPWQTRLAEIVCSGKWPSHLDLPTGSGKTACIDIAVFALAVQAALPPARRSVGRRIFFIVNRRVIVDEAHRRAEYIAQTLGKAFAVTSPDSILHKVAAALSTLSPVPAGEVPAPPLDVVQLRGGIRRDNRWARSICQPIVVATTIDQAGSRLLFRGYGLSPGACPIHAALIAYDSLLLLDEAHISRPFAQTVDRVRRYMNVKTDRSEGVAPFDFVRMTATQFVDDLSDSMFGLNDADRRDAILARRLLAPKPARLVVAPGSKGKDAPVKLASALVQEAVRILSEVKPPSLAVMVNRVATARAVAAELEQIHPGCVTLLIGRMRPLDKDNATMDIVAYLKTRVANSSGSNTENINGSAVPRIVVATQCLEVGADLDFAALVTECASLDALRQRFGRLNRAGGDFTPAATIVMREDLIEKSAKKLADRDASGKPLDPIYGNALSRTWNWLHENPTGGSIDFSIAAMDRMVRSLPSEIVTALNAPSEDAPALMPACLDAWVQTSPRPSTDPDPAVFIHGLGRGQPEVMICWRADLHSDDDFDDRVQTLSICPPTVGECLPVALSRFAEWLFERYVDEDQAGDLLSGDDPSFQGYKGNVKPLAKALAWRGQSGSIDIKSRHDLRPGDTIALPVSAGGWSKLGHVPNAPADPSANSMISSTPIELSRMDIAETSFRQRHQREILRLRPELIPNEGDLKALGELLEWAGDPEGTLTIREIREALKEATVHREISASLSERLGNLANEDLGIFQTRYPGGIGICLQNRHPIDSSGVDSMDDDDDSLSATGEARGVTLEEHSNHVVLRAGAAIVALPVGPDIRNALITAARLHDWGKADPRFQALLLSGDAIAAGALEEPLAKSPGFPGSLAERRRARERSELPRGFRHEMLSVQLAAASDEIAELFPDSALRDLLFHLVGSHHGFGRPFAPVVADDHPPETHVPSMNTLRETTLSPEQRLSRPSHHVASGVASRFWSLSRRYGWWGLAYLESILRLADQQASASENRSETKKTSSE